MMTNSIFSLGKYMKKAAVTTLIFGLLISPSFALNSSFSSGSSQSLSTIVQALTEGNWLAVADTSWYDSVIQNDADATEFTISTAAELAGLAKLVNSGVTFKGLTIELTNDIDLGEHYWVPIGDEDHAFKGTFNGQEHTIKNMLIGAEDEVADYNYAGLFGYIEGATIKNLNIDENSKIYNLGAYIGGFCGLMDQSTIDNCINRGVIYSYANSDTYESNVGGICGYVCADIDIDSQEDQNTNPSSTISNCYNYGTISSQHNDTDGLLTVSIGGICGQVTCIANIYKCNNAGWTYSFGEAALDFVGGICGQATYIALEDDQKATIKDCKNIQALSSILTGSTSSVGGICGSASYDIIIDNCENNAMVSSSAYKPEISIAEPVCDAGGICGSAFEATISNCVNNNNIIAFLDVASETEGFRAIGERFVGGICGYTSNADKIIDNTNTSLMTANEIGNQE